MVREDPMTHHKPRDGPPDQKGQATTGPCAKSTATSGWGMAAGACDTTGWPETAAEPGGLPQLHFCTVRPGASPERAKSSGEEESGVGSKTGDSQAY